MRRYQNKDGSLTEEGRIRQTSRNRIKNSLKTKDKVDSIFKNMTYNDRRLLGANPGDKEVLTLQQGEWLVKRFLIEDGDIPVAFFDILAEPKKGSPANVALGVRSDYKGRGYGSKVAKKGMNWLDKNLDKFSHVEWNALVENNASRYMAKKYGFGDEAFYKDEKGNTMASYIKMR